MAADASLVNASFNLGKARAGANTPNMAPLMQANVGISASFLKIAQGAMGGYKKKQEIKRVGKEKQLKGFEKIFNNTLVSLYEQEEPLPQPFIDMLTERVEGLQAEFETYNTYGKGDTSENNRQRARLTGELKRTTNEINNYRGGLMQFAIDRKQGLLNEGLIKKGDIAPAEQVLDLVNFDKNVAAGLLVPSYGEDGKIQVLSIGEWGEVIVTMESLNKAFPPINTVQDANILERQTESGNTGKADGLKQNPTNNYDYDQRHSEYLDGLNTDDAVSNIVARKIKGVGGNNPSFKDALLSDVTIPIDVLDNMFYDDMGERVEVGIVFKKQLDIDGKEGIASEDYDMAKDLGKDALAAFEKNLDEMIDAITNDENPAFDRGTTAELLATYLTNMDKEKYDNNYNAAVKSKDGGKSATGSQIIYDRTNLGEKSFVVQDNILDKAMNNEPIISWGNDKFIPDPENPGNYKQVDSMTDVDVLKDGNKISIPIDNLLRGKHFGMNERINSRKLEYPTGLPIDINAEKPPKAEEKIKVSNTKPSINGVVYPSKDITRSTAGTSKGNLKLLTDLYTEKFGVSFIKSVTTKGAYITMTGPDGETQEVEMNRYGAANNMESQDIIQQFVLKYAKK